MEKEDKSEISISEILKHSKSYLKYFLAKWYLILLLILLGAISGYWYAANQKPKYSGLLTFVLSSESKSSGLGGLASQFGIDLGSSSGSDVFAGDNIITLFKSRKMITKVLFKKPPLKNELLINTLVKEYNIDKDWEKNENLKGAYPFSENLQLTPVQDSLVNEIYLKISQDLLSINRNDKKLSVYEVNTTSTNEIFSTFLTRYLVDETAHFYIDTKTSIAKQNLRMLQNEADSIRSLLGTKISSTASEVDRTFNLNPALQVQRTSIQRGQINVSVLTAAYGEVIKNLELAKINLQKETPLYQVIDVPSIPLKAIRVRKFSAALFGASIAFILIVFYLFFMWRLSHKPLNTSLDEQ